MRGKRMKREAQRRSRPMTAGTATGHSPASPGYPLSGCSPAEPNSVSPSKGNYTANETWIPKLETRKNFAPAT